MKWDKICVWRVWLWAVSFDVSYFSKNYNKVKGNMNNNKKAILLSGRPTIGLPGSIVRRIDGGWCCDGCRVEEVVSGKMSLYQAHVWRVS